MSAEQVTERRLAAATVLAVLSLVFSSLSLLGTFFRAMALAVIRFARVLVETMPDDTGAAAGLLAGAVDSMVSFSVLVTLVRAAIAGLGLAAGIGLLSRFPL